MDGDSPTQEGSVPDKAAQVAARKRAIKERVKKQIVFIAALFVMLLLMRKA
jgi:hypothetical protein